MRSSYLIVALTPLIAASAFASAGGPDAYGYTWADGYESGGPSYNYEYVGTTASISSDDGSQEVQLPFSFDFYGWTTDTVRIHVDGALSMFGTTNLSTWNSCPMTGNSDWLIAPYWDDLLVSNGGAIIYGTLGTAPNRRFIVEWYGVGHELSGGNLTFEVKIFESDSHIEFHYDDVTLDSSSYTWGASASIGLQGSSAMSPGCNYMMISDDETIAFYPPASTGCDDWDSDGWCGVDDCNDFDPSINPGMTELCDGYDNDCDGQTDEGYDADYDGYSTCNSDCDDGDYSVNPGASEVCNAQDDDCDLQVDEGFDNDNDDWTTCEGDCSDNNAQVNPGATEIPGDGLDNDCFGGDAPVGDDDDAGDDDTVGDDDAGDDDAGDDDAGDDDAGDDDAGDDDAGDDDAGDDDAGDDDAGDDDAGDDDAADDNSTGGGGGGGRRRGCNQAEAEGTSPAALLALAALGLLRRRRAA